VTVFEYRDFALHHHNTGKRGDKILDEHLTTVGSLRGNKIRRLATSSPTWRCSMRSLSEELSNVCRIVRAPAW